MLALHLGLLWQGLILLMAENEVHQLVIEAMYNFLVFEVVAQW